MTLGPETCLPTLSRLGQPHIPEDLDTSAVSSEWLSSFGKFCETSDVDGVLSLLVASSFESNIFKGDNLLEPTSPDDLPVYWRDALALTWDIRTFQGSQKIKKFLFSQLSKAKIINVQLDEDRVKPQLQRPFPDLAWIQLLFKFETGVGLCSGAARLIPIADSQGQNITWKAFSVFTNLDDLKGFPEQTGPFRNHQPNHGKWEKAREEEIKFENKDPAVLIIGGGHSGLNAAARLKALGVQSLIVEKNHRIGDNWRTRYEALCLHDPVCRSFPPFLQLFMQYVELSSLGYDHLPYIPWATFILAFSMVY